MDEHPSGLVIILFNLKYTGRESLKLLQRLATKEDHQKTERSGEEMFMTADGTFGRECSQQVTKDQIFASCDLQGRHSVGFLPF